MSRTQVWRWIGTGIAFAVLATLVSACGDVMPYHAYRSVPGGMWSKADTLKFDDLPVLSDSGRYDLYVDLRTTEDFPYTGIYIGVLSRPGSAFAWQRDTVHCVVRSATGRPSGRGFTLRHSGSRLYRLLPSADRHPQVRLFHIMRREDLPGVGEVGLKIVPVTSDEEPI
ncbi:MAG: gliding motility lipoprotein GldH [Clostridium sp.]|nr:gliding motility lipoprotein GldH [Clostridium sp.]